MFVPRLGRRERAYLEGTRGTEDAASGRAARSAAAQPVFRQILLVARVGHRKAEVLGAVGRGRQLDAANGGNRNDQLLGYIRHGDRRQRDEPVAWLGRHALEREPRAIAQLNLDEGLFELSFPSEALDRP